MISDQYIRRVSKVNKKGNNVLDVTAQSSALQKKKKTVKKVKNIALKNKDEWLSYLTKNIKNVDYDMGGSQWPKHLLTYISKHK